MRRVVLALVLLFIITSGMSHATLAPFLKVIAKEAIKGASGELGKTVIEEFKRLFNNDKEIAKKGNPQLKEGKLVQNKRRWIISPGKLSSDDLKELAKILKSVDNNIDQEIKVNGSDNVVATTQSGNVNFGTYQEVLGDNAVTSFNQQGGITAQTVYITPSELKDSKKVMEEILAEYEKGKEIENAELKRRLAEIHKVEFNVLPKEADEWAQLFVDSLPLRKDKIKTIENDKRSLTEKEITKLPIIFEYVLQNLDTKIAALQKRITNIMVERPEDYILIVDLEKHKSTPKYLTRRITFPNKHSVELILRPGILEKGLFIDYPELEFREVTNNRTKKLFSIGRPYLGRGYVKLGYPVIDDIQYSLDDPLNEGFKNRLSQSLDKLIEMVYLDE